MNDHEPCPDCRDDSPGDSLHRDDCLRVGTCGQFGPPWLAPPWHVTPEPLTASWLVNHRAETGEP